MAEIQFSDNDLGFISMVLAKVDPTGIMTEAVGIQQKIRAYAQQKQQEQMATASVETPDEG